MCAELSLFSLAPAPHGPALQERAGLAQARRNFGHPTLQAEDATRSDGEAAKLPGANLAVNV
jgi:hypothetical protein